MKIEDLDGSLWGFMRSEGWKGHFCPSALMAGLLEDSAARGHELTQLEKASEGSIDLPGMIRMDRSWQTIRIDTFNLSMPTTDYEYFYRELKRGEQRVFSTGQLYYKIHGWLICVVFTPEQRELVLKYMEEQLEFVREQAKKENEEFAQAIDKINQGGVKVISPRAPNSIPKVPVSGKSNGELN